MDEKINALERFLAILARIPGLEFLEDRRLEMRRLKQRIDNKIGDIEGDKNAVLAAGEHVTGKGKSKKTSSKKVAGGTKKKRKKRPPRSE